MSNQRTPLIRKPTLGLVGIGLLGAFPAVAQSAAEPVALPESNATLRPPISFRRDEQPAPRLPTAIAETPQSVTVVPREVIEQRAASSVRDALRNVTGISLAAGEGGFSGDALTLRGFSARGDFFIDGIRDLGQYTRDPFFLDSIEVLKGPASIAFGRGSTGGIINQTTRLPVSRTFGDAAVSLYAPGGYRVTTDVNVAAGSVAARLQTMDSRIDAARRDGVFQDRWGVAPSITWGLGGPTQVTLSHLHQEEDNIPDYGLPYLNGRPAPVRLGTFYGVASLDGERTTTDVTTLRVQHRFDEHLTLRNTTRWGFYQRSLNATAPRLANVTTLGRPFNALTTPLEQIQVTRQPQVRDGLDTVLVNQTEALANFNTGALRHNVLAGFEIGRESAEATRHAFANNATGRPLATLIEPNRFVSQPVRRSVASDIKTTADTYALYAIDQIRIGEQLEVLLGGRWDSFEADQANRSNSQVFSRTDTAFTWRGALVFKPNTDIRTYFAYGTSFNPSAESLTLAANNAALPPEENESYEFGASWEALERLRLSGAVFRIEKTNARTSDPAGNLQVLDGVARVDGAEIAAVGRITPRWNVLAGYTYLDSEIVRTRQPAELGREFANVAPHTVALWTTYDLPLDLQVGGGLSYVDRRFGNNTNTNRVPSYTRWDLAASWAPTEGQLRGWRLQVNALNLFDVKTFETVYTAHAVPGTGRTVVFTIAAGF